MTEEPGVAPPGRMENLAELRTFVAIVDAGSLAGAARRLGVSPNAVSRRLTSLEQRLGRRLILRTTRRTSVTEEGLRLSIQLRAALETLDRAEMELDGLDGLAGVVRLGVHTDMVGPALSTALARLVEEEAGIELDVQVSHSFVDPVAAGLDISVHVGRPPASSHKAASLGRLVWALAAAPSYIERHGSPRTPSQLAQHECLRLRRDRTETSWVLRRGGTEKRFAVGGRFETTDGHMLAHALYAGIGIGVLLSSELDASVAQGRLVPVLRQWTWSSTPVYALMPPGREGVPRVRAVLEALRETTRRLA
ncbi:MAG: LysR family transcriptional regulator [Nannocystaceae bacterium]|nr:LysR family transcriptional regulator [Nannocystaceae bacterium]